MDLPDYIDKESWEGFSEMRKKMKKPLTDRSKKMALKMLENLRLKGEDVNLVLDQSEFYQWQGLFPVKPEFYNLMGVDRTKETQQAVVLRMVDRDWAK